MQRYDSYKDSGIQWLGEIPSHWEVRRVRMIVTSEHGISYKPSDITDETGVLVLRASNIQDGKLSFDDNVYVKEVPQNKKLKKGDIILCATNGSLSLVGKSTIIDKDNEYSFGTFMLALRTSQSERFINYQLGRVIDNYRGLFATTTINQITQQVLGNMSMALPPLPEQQAIASYLDTATAKIDEAIAQQQKMIDLLNERKQIIINNAVTKGLNPNAKMKPSGIDWIGNIPEHWEVTTLKKKSKIILGKMLSSGSGNQYDYFCAKDVHYGSVDDTDLKQMFFTDTEREQYKVNYGDMLIVEGGAGAGGCAIYKGTKTAYIQNSIMIVRGSEDMVNEYICYFLQSINQRGYVEFICNKATIPHFTKDKVGRVNIAIPPIEEQSAIVEFIEKTCTPIDCTISSTQKQITLLQERKQIIINDVVTGKVKVS